MSLLYLTADEIGIETGGGAVTANELSALRSLGDTHVISRTELAPGTRELKEPWCWDAVAWHMLPKDVSLAHGYAGTFMNSVQLLKERGVKCSWTIAAHCRQRSRAEHATLGLPFPYTHLTDEGLWQRYIAGYAASDVIICPSTHSANVVRHYGGVFETKRIEIIPHGCTPPTETRPLPSTFTFGYLGAVGCDKGIRVLLQAWKRLAYTDSVLVFAGRESTGPLLDALLQAFGGGGVIRMGGVKNTSDFYNRISCYVSSSQTEGFGIPILEAMSHARPAIVSTGAGACDLVPEFCRFPAGDVDALCERIEAAKKTWDLGKLGADCRKIAERHTWPLIQERYKEVWRSLL